MPIKSEFAAIPIANEPFHEALLRAFWTHSCDRPSQPALIDEDTGEKITFQQLYIQAHSIATYLDGIHFGRGDVACVVLPNCWQYPTFFLGVALTGGAMSGASFLFTDYELQMQFSDSRCKIVLTSEDNLERVMKAAKNCPNMTAISVIPRSKDSQLPWGVVTWDYIVGLEPNIYRKRPTIDHHNDVVLLPYSSGTTGSPKGVMLTHRNLKTMMDVFVNHMEVVMMPKLDPNWKWRDESMLLFLPFYHIYGFLLMLALLYKGVKCPYMSHFDQNQYLGAIEKYRVRMISVVPPILVLLAKSPLVSKFDVSSLQFVVSGAAPAGKDLIEELIQRLPNLKFVGQGYGMTECGMASHFPVPGGQTKPHSAGKLASNFEMKIVDLKTGAECDPNQQGEVWLRGPTVMLGYLNKPQATAETITPDGWLRTGDIGYVDEHGFLFVCDRLKELIKVKGLQVPPAELEDLLLSHSQIRDAAVIGVPDEKSGELPKAYVVRANDKLTAKEVFDFVAAKVSHYKQLKGGVEFINEVPKSAAGKILRRMLREKCISEMHAKKTGNQGNAGSKL